MGAYTMLVNSNMQLAINIKNCRTVRYFLLILCHVVRFMAIDTWFTCECYVIVLQWHVLHEF
jgi:hypothetical protein